MSSLEQTIARAAALPCWTGQPRIAPLEGGITNVNLLVTDDAGKFVVRFGQDIPEHGILRFNELAISQAAHDAGVSPGIHHSEPGILVLEFVESAALTENDLLDADTLVETTRLIRKVHMDVTQKARGPVLAFWVFHVLRDYAGFLTRTKSRHTGKLADLMAEAAKLEADVGPINLVLGHNDLLPANILRAPDRLWLIDWEYGGFNSPLFDLGGLATNCGLPPEAEHLMLETYFDASPDTKLMRSYGAMKCASLLRETMWSMVSEHTSDIDFDYAAYTAENLARYRRAFSEFYSQRGTR